MKNRFLVAIKIFCCLFAIQVLPNQFFSGLTVYSVEAMTILSMYIKNPAEVGEIAPISKSAGIELAKFVGAPADDNGKIYLEAGGGCGSITSCIIDRLRPQDHLDVVEINQEMCEVLRTRFAAYDNVSIHCCSILDWQPGYHYDGIVSTLPFLSLGIDFSKEAVRYFKNVSHKGAMFSCVEYPVCTLCRTLAQSIVSKKTADLTLVQRYMKKVRLKYLKEYSTIYLNVPPINVYHLCFNS